MANITNLKPSKLNPNVWYHVSEGRVDKINSTKLTSMLQLQPDGTPAVWAANVDNYWQFQPFPGHTGRYQMRCITTSIQKQFSVCYTPNEVTTGNTRPCMASSNGDLSQQWDISDWGDGSYRLVNVQNGTDYVLDVHKGNPPYMSSNLRTDIDQPAQHWIMTSYSLVNEADYSTVFTDVSTPTTTSSSSSPTSTTASASQSSGSASGGGSSHNGLSAGAAAGVGIGVGLGAIGLALLAFFFIRRRQRSKQNIAELGGSTPPETDPSMKSHDPYSSVNGSPPPHTGGDTPQHDASALWRSSSVQRTPKDVLASHPRVSPGSAELPYNPAPVEAPGEAAPQELDSTPFV